MNWKIDQIYAGGRTGAVRVIDYINSETNVINPNKKITKSKKIMIYFNYPLTNPTILTFKNNKGFSRMDIFKAIYEGYTHIYNLEEKTCGPTGNIPGNRKLSIGQFGIWGHHIDQLFIEGFDIDNENIKLHMGS